MDYLLWNNHFYGICIAGLIISSSLYLTNHLPSMTFLIMAYISTVVYYTNAYFNESVNEQNEARAIWYQAHYSYLKKRQWLLTAALIILAIFSIIQYPKLLQLDIFSISCLSFSFIISVLYNHTDFKKHGLLKSIAIAFVWTVVGGYMPLYFNTVIGFEVSQPFLTQLLYLIQLFLFIFLLAVLFDIKDMKKDQISHIQTIPIQIGLEHIKYRLVLPFLMASIVIDLLQAGQFHFTFLAWVMQFLFYIVVYWSAILAIKEESIAKSILLVDGLMILKALIGILSWYWVLQA